MKHISRAALAAAILLLPLFSLSGCAAAPAAAPVPGVAEYGFTPPEGFTAAEEPAGMYRSPDYPGDASNIYSVCGTSDPYFSGYTAEMMADALSRMLTEQYGTGIPVTVESFDYTAVDGLPAYRMRTSYTVDGLQLQQLVVAVNADANYTFTWTCVDDAGWMDAFEKSADSLWFRTQ